MPGDLNHSQLNVLRWISEGSLAGAEPTPTYRTSAAALRTRRLIQTKGRGRQWRAAVTEAGQHYLSHGEYPPGHFMTAEPERTAKPAVPNASPSGPGRPRGTAAKGLPQPQPMDVDSPRGVRRAGRKPKGDALFPDDRADPWDEKILVSVKEAAWLLSLHEGAIRRAAMLGDLERVFVGDGHRNYRIVYGSLLAWVNGMPRESSTQRWW